MVVALRVPDVDDERGFREVVSHGGRCLTRTLWRGGQLEVGQVYDLKAEKVVFLKDSWRFLLPHLENGVVQS